MAFPKYKPTEADRTTVKTMAAGGFRHEEIARCLGTNGIDKKTMYVHFREELDTSLAKANAAVVNRLYQMAKDGNPPAATFFWLKCKAGWREVERIEHTGVDGAAINIEVDAAELLASRIARIAERRRADKHSGGAD